MWGLSVACAPTQLGLRGPCEPGLADRSGPAPRGYLVQGFAGATVLGDVSLEPTGNPIGVEDVGTSTLPLLGAAVMYPLSGERFQMGVEMGVTTGWDADRGLVRLNNATQTRSDNRLVLVDGFVGAYANVYLNRSWRLYGGAGPVLQFGSVDVEYTDENSERVDLNEDGFGLGVYARAGVELLLWNGTWAGIGVRRLDSRFDPGGSLSDFDFEAMQYVFTATYRY